MKEKNFEKKRFLWRTGNSYIKRIEEKLLNRACRGLSGKVLEVGCGTGANFFFLKRYFSDLTGLDIDQESLAIANREIKQAKFLKADALAIPYSNDTFEVVFTRDCLHHMDLEKNKKKALAEMRRVCLKGGRIVIIEPNIKNIVIKLQSLIQAEEKGIKDSRVEFITKLMQEDGYHNIAIDYAEPLPFDRLLTHFRFGVSFLGRVFIIRWLFDLFNLFYKLLIPKKFWSYIIIRAQK